MSTRAVFGRSAQRTLGRHREGTLVLAAIIVYCCCLVSPSVYAQTGMRAFLGTAAEKMTEDDWKLARDAALQVLTDTEAKPPSHSWHNSANDHHGVVSLVKSFDSSDGRPCKRLRFDNEAEGVKGTASYNVCRSPEGKWQLDS